MKLDIYSQGVQDDTFRVLTYNIQYRSISDPASGVGDHWDIRRRPASNLVHKTQAQIIGMQEVSYIDAGMRVTQAQHIAEDLTSDTGNKWAVAHATRMHAVLWDTTRFMLMEGPYTFDVNVEHTRPNPTQRAATWSVFTDLVTYTQFVFINTHFQHDNATMRAESAEIISDKANEIRNGRPVIITGDFNSGSYASGQPYGIFAGHGYINTRTLSDNEINGEWNSFNSYDPNLRPGGSWIDGILVSENDFFVKQVALWADFVNGETPPVRKPMPSDHNPLSADIGFGVEKDTEREVFFSTLDIRDFNIDLESSPLDSDDTSGGVGSFNVTINRPLDPDNPINTHGVNVLTRKFVEMDTPFGHIAGEVTGVNEGDNGRTISLTVASRAGKLNVYNVRAKPYKGTLGGILEYYRTLAGNPYPFEIDPTIRDREVIAPGWEGELWYYLKMLAAAESIQISITPSGQAHFGPIRNAEAAEGNTFETSHSVDSPNLAEFVEIYEYNSIWVDNYLVYPRGGWTEDVEVLSVSAGEYEETEIELEGSIESIIPPKMVDNVSRGEVSKSVYTIVGDDGLPIKPKQWEDSGGLIEFEIGPESNTLIVKMTGAKSIIMSNGEPSQSYALALAADGSGSRYSTLRVLGTGVLYDHEPLKIPTGVSRRDTGTEVGATIDNPFLSDRLKVFTAAVRAAAKFSGFTPALQAGMAQVSEHGMGPKESGARVHYNERPYRIRSASYTPNGVQLTAEDDLTVGDVQDALGGFTYGEIQQRNEGLTYLDVRAKGRQV